MTRQSTTGMERDHTAKRGIEPLRYTKRCSVQKAVERAIIYGLLLLIGFVFMIPLFWMVSTSLKITGAEFLFPPQWIPKPFKWSNYPEALALADFHIYFKNTTLIVIVRLVGALITASMAGYSFARLRYPGRDKLFTLVLSTMMLPAIVTLKIGRAAWRERVATVV